MANEAVCIEKSVVNDITRTISSTAAIEKGSLMWLADGNVISGASAYNVPFGGITTAEKVSTDGSTKLSCTMNGVYDCKIAEGGTCRTGDLLILSGANMLAVMKDISSISGGCIVGKAEEDASAGEVIRVRLIGY